MHASETLRGEQWELEAVAYLNSIGAQTKNKLKLVRESGATWIQMELLLEEFKVNPKTRNPVAALLAILRDKGDLPPVTTKAVEKYAHKVKYKGQIVKGYTIVKGVRVLVSDSTEKPIRFIDPRLLTRASDNEASESMDEQTQRFQEGRAQRERDETLRLTRRAEAVT